MPAGHVVPQAPLALVQFLGPIGPKNHIFLISVFLQSFLGPNGPKNRCFVLSAISVARQDPLPTHSNSQSKIEYLSFPMHQISLKSDSRLLRYKYILLTLWPEFSYFVSNIKFIL